MRLVFAVLLVWLIGTPGRAQFRAEKPSRPDSLKTLAPTAFDERRSLDRYVRDAPLPTPAQRPSGDRSRFDPALSRGQKIFLGAVGLVVQSVCATDETKPLTARPASLLGPRERTCVQCDRMEDRAWEAVWEGLFSPNP